MVLMSDIPEYTGEPDYINSDGEEVYIVDGSNDDRS